MPSCARRVEIDMRRSLARQERRGTLGVLGVNSAATAKWRWTCSHVDMLPCCRRGAGVAGAARRDHDGYSDTPGRPVLVSCCPAPLTLPV